MRRVFIRWCFVIACLLAQSGAAQESAYGLQYLGASEETGDARARGLGLLGVALNDAHTAITLNPASHGALERMTISFLGVAGGYSAQNGTITNDRSFARFPHLRIALPVFGQAVLSVGFVGWRNFEGAYVLPTQSVGDFTYTQDFNRNGTLYTIPLGVARRFGKFVQAGLTLDFLLGTIDESWTSGGDSLLAMRTRRRDTFSGRGLTFGLMAQPLPQLTLGASFAPQFSSERNEHFTIEDGRSTGGPTHRDSSALSDVTMPFVVRAGGKLALGPRWMVASDFSLRDWESYNGRLYGLTGTDPVRSEMRFGAGIEFVPQRAAWWGRPTYRVGASQTTWPQRVGGADLQERALHAGAGMNLRGGNGRFDVGFEYARIGNLGDNGAEESVWRVLIGFSGQELWRRKSPRS